MACCGCLPIDPFPPWGAECADRFPLHHDLQIADPPAVYRPRHPEKTAFYQLFQDHFDSYVQAYEERFEPQSGPLRPVVVRSVEEFLACGRLEGGFARLRCPKCRAEHLLALACASYYTSCAPAVRVLDFSSADTPGSSYMYWPMSSSL